MKCLKVIIALAIMAMSLLIPMVILTEDIDSQPPGIICTTSILAHLTEQIGQNLVSVTTIAPVGMCPAHFDIKPSQIQAVREAKLLISHDFEPWIENLLTSADHTDIERLIFSGPWNTPAGAIDKIHQITDTLSIQFPENKQQFDIHSQQLVKEINRNGDQLKIRAEKSGISQLKVIASFHQASFVEWLGLKVIATYPSPEMISTKQYLELLLMGKNEEVDLIVDNLQSGTDFGAKLATDLGATQVVLTNFPGLIPQTDSLASMMSYNAEQLFKVIEGDLMND